MISFRYMSHFLHSMSQSKGNTCRPQPDFAPIESPITGEEVFPEQPDLRPRWERVRSEDFSSVVFRIGRSLAGTAMRNQ
jgi:hypothetical protein